MDVEIDNLRPIGWEWASGPEYDRTAGARLLLDRPEPCLLCGHSTGDCVGEHMADPKIVSAETEAAASGSGERLLDASHGDAKVISPSDVTDSDGYVKVDTYVEVQAPLARTKSYRLAYAKGQFLSPAERDSLKK